MELYTENIHEDLGQPDNIIIISTDGSYHKDKSGGAYIIANENGNIIAKGSNPDTGEQTYQQSYRSEAQAKLSGHLCLHHLCKYYSITPPKTISSCDNQGLRVKLMSKKIQKRATDLDLIHEIKKLCDSGNTYTHVYGHQEETSNNLTTEAYLNIIVDKIAHSNARRPVQIHPPNQTAVYINKQYIPYGYDKYLRKTVGKKEAKQFLKKVQMG